MSRLKKIAISVIVGILALGSMLFVLLPADSYITYDCSQVLPRNTLPSAGLTLKLKDNTSKPDKANLDRLGRLACSAADASIKVVQREGKSWSWIFNMPVFLDDTVEGNTENAHLEAFIYWPTEIHISIGALKNFSEHQFLFTVGHEYGHGVYHHSLYEKLQIIVAIIIGIGLLSLTFVVIYRRVPAAYGEWTGFSAGLIAGCVTAAIFGVLFMYGESLFNISREKEADAFGVRAMVQAGVSFTMAIDETVALFANHSEPEPRFLRDAQGHLAIPDIKAHPGTKTRIEAVKAIKQNS